MAVTLNETPSGNRLHIGIFGKTNSGKSSFINTFSGQKVSIVADVAGTTTDPVYKPMEIYPLGPCIIIDTAGFDDESTLGEQRVERTRLAAQKADLAIIVFSAYRSSESYRKAKAAIQWDCSVTCTEESTSAKYVITYSDVKVLSKTGTLTIQNKNDFDIVVHLLCEGEQEVVSDNIPANSFYSFTNVTDKEYTVGIHADVGVAADIRVVVYDGKDTEPYTK